MSCDIKEEAWKAGHFHFTHNWKPDTCISRLMIILIGDILCIRHIYKNTSNHRVRSKVIFFSKSKAAMAIFMLPFFLSAYLFIIANLKID